MWTLCFGYLRFCAGAASAGALRNFFSFAINPLCASICLYVVVTFLWVVFVWSSFYQSEIPRGFRLVFWVPLLFGYNMSQTMENWWAILPSWVVLNPCFAKLPTPCHQGYSANFVNSTSYCGLPECSPNCPKWRSLQVAHCLGWFCTLLVIFGHNNNLQFSIIQKITKLLCSEASFIFLAWQASFMKIHGKFQKVIS